MIAKERIARTGLKDPYRFWLWRPRNWKSGQACAARIFRVPGLEPKHSERRRINSSRLWGFAKREARYDPPTGERSVPYDRYYERHFPDRDRCFLSDWNFLNSSRKKNGPGIAGAPANISVSQTVDGGSTARFLPMLGTGND
jgi:hypothetical protein